MRVVFVTGPAFAGKSQFIAREFPEAKVIDMRVFSMYVESADTNEQLEEIAENADKYCHEALRRTVANSKEDDVIVLEHPMLMRRTREFYISAVRQVTDKPIECFLLLPNEEELNKIIHNQPSLRSLHEYEKQMMEMPVPEEGFVTVQVVDSVF